jgi:hypothetical protein
VLNHEGREFKWLSLADAQALELNLPTRVLLDAVLKLRQTGT